MIALLSRRFPARTLASSLVLAALALQSGCAGTKPQRTDIVFPLPPDPPRFRFIRQVHAMRDLDLPVWRRALGLLIPSLLEVGIAQPSSVALSPDDRFVYVATPKAKRLVVLDRKKETLRYMADDGSVRFPASVAVDADGSVFVVDRAGQVVVYDPEGKVLRQFGGDRLRAPTGIAVDRQNRLVYVLSGCTKAELDHVVEVYSPKGEHLRTIGGKRGEAEGQFNFPSAVAVSPDGELLVSDMLNFRVQVFDAQGNLRRTFGQAGAGYPGHFDKIRRVAFDAGGRIYVLDFMQGVHVLDDRLRPLLLFGTGWFQGPQDIAIDSKNRIFIVDLTYGLVEMALIDDSTPTEPPAPATQDAAK